MGPSRQIAVWDLPGQQDAKEPLLPQHTAAHSSQLDTQYCLSRMTGSRQTDHSAKQQRESSVDLGSRFMWRLWRIMCIINALPALSLVLISLAETVIVSKIGTITGLFYQVFVDGQASQVRPLMLWSTGCYTATALFFSFKAGLQDFFAWRWRSSLTVHLQQVYCANIGATCPKSKAPLLQSLDNPDQRVAQDLPLLTTSLSEVLTQLAAVPFNIFWYTHLTRQVFGSWTPVLCAYVFFLLGLVLQRLVMLPVASAVYQQEAAEGAFRYGHTRFRAWAAEIAMYRSEAVEQQHLEGQLSRVLVCQGRLMLRRAVLTATSRLLDYGGLVVNFGCLAAAVFRGAWSGPGQSAGDIASKVSIASFYLLTLIYNFSQILDLANKVANLAGLTARVSQMLEALMDSGTKSEQQRPQDALCGHSSSSSSSRRYTRRRSSNQAGVASTEVDLDTPAQSQQDYPKPSQQQQQQPLQEVAAGKSPSHQRYASQAVLLQAPQLVLVPVPEAAAAAAAESADSMLAAGSAAAEGGAMTGLTDGGAEGKLHCGQGSPQQQPLLLESGGLPQQQQQQVTAIDGADLDVMQVSIHSMGADMLLQEVRRAFPDSPGLAPLLAVVTFQFCGAARGVMMRRLQQQQQQEVQGLMLDTPTALQSDNSSSGNSSSSSSSQMQPGCCPSCASGTSGCEGQAGAGSSSSGGSGGCRQGVCADADMQHMLAVFMTWQQTVHDHITSSGYWCDVIDPRTGAALHSTPGSHYDEVIGASVLLGYDQVTPEGRTLSLISHPEAATQVYPATLFTSAPLQVVREALRRAAAAAAAPVHPQQLLNNCPDSPQQQQQRLAASTSSSHQPKLPLPPPAAIVSPDCDSSSWCATKPTGCTSHTQQQQQQQLLLSCSQLTVLTPAGVPVVQGLSLQLAAGQSLLIQGPSGCGKSTLVSCLAGLWPLGSGQVNCTAAHTAAPAAATGLGVVGSCQAAAGRGGGESAVVGGVMFVPQRSLAAPGLTLRQQLLYPAAASVLPCSCSITNNRSIGLQVAQLAGPRQQQRQRQRQRQPAGSSRWWLNWLSCGLHQQQLALGMHAAGPSAAGAALEVKQQQQQQLSLPLLPPPQSSLCQQQQQLSLCSSCQQLLAVLDCVGLRYLLSAMPAGLHTRHEAWGDVLSPGELQRLTFARVLLHKPALVVLDEATSALPDVAAVQLYRQLQAVGVSYASVGHSRCLVEWHDRVLCVAGDGRGGWSMG